MASIVIKSTDSALTLDQNRRKGMVDAGAKIALAIDTESAKPNPSFDAAFAKAVALDTLAAFINDTANYVVEYRGFPLVGTGVPNKFQYTDATSAIQELTIKPVADGRVNKMSITVPVPATPGLSVLQGYGPEVIEDIASFPSSALADAQKYLLATAMFRRCR